MLNGKLRWLLLALCLLGMIAHAQETKLEPGKPIEREIAGGQSHTYQITLQAGQFMRVVVEQKGVNLAVALRAPDGKRLVETNLTAGFGQESLSFEAASGQYMLVVRTVSPAALARAYGLRLEVRAVVTAEDRQRIAAEKILTEASPLARQGGAASQQAIEKYEEAIRLWREIGDRYWEAQTLYAVARAYNRLSRNDKAIEYLEQALQISRETKDRAGEASALVTLGTSNYSLSRYDKAVEYFDQSLVIFRELKDRESEGGVLLNLGAVSNSTSRHDKAIVHYEQALSIMREVKNRGAEGFVLTGLGNMHIALDRYDKAIEYLEQSLAIYREVKDRITEGLTLRNLGVVYDLLGRNEESISYYNQSLSIARELKDRRGEGATLNNLGLIYFNWSRYDKAIECYEQALQISREVKNRGAESNALNNLANAYSSMGHYDKAVGQHEQALAISREIKDRAGEARALMSMGVVYNFLSRQDKAIGYLDQALSLTREIKDQSGERSALNNLGDVHRSAGRHDEAIKYYEQALAINREIKTVAGEPTLLNNLGNVHFLMGRYDKSIEYYGRGLAASREAKDRVVEGRVLAGLGDTYVSLGRYDKARPFFEQSLTILREVKDRSSEAGTLYRFARAEGRVGNLDQARALVEESLKIVESMRSEIYNPESRSSYFASMQVYNDLHIDLLMRLHKASPSQGFDGLAVEASERARARGLLEQLTEAGNEIRQGVDASLVERERALALQLNGRATRRMQLLSVSHKPEQMAALVREISQLENDFERVQAEIRRTSPRYAALRQPQRLSLKQIQQQLDQETMLLEYSLGEERSYLWAITHDSITNFELPKQERIKEATTSLYNLMTARSHSEKGETAQQRQQRVRQAEAQLPEAAHTLSSILLGPVASQLAKRRLIVVADGALQYIPFAMLPDPAAGSQSPVVGKNANANRPPATGYRPLVVNHEIISLPSASTLALQRKELADRKPAPKMLAVIADPVFGHTDVRFKWPAPEESDKAQPQTIAFNNARSIEHLAEKSDDKAGTTTHRSVIPRLPFTRQEATRLLALTPKSSSFGAIDFQANRATVLKGDLSQYRYVHFATHGLLDSERPGLSSLVLSMVDAEGKPQDGFLRANDIYNLKLPAELVVLSACQTGLGKEIKGEGLVGLTRGFMYAGAARVVVSLWNVNDKATAELMAKFYEKMLKQGERPAAALRAAQVEMWKQKQWQSPYYWAAFTMQGEWK